VSKENSSGGSSYGQILRSSSIIGGAQAISFIIGLARTKFVALVIGPSGIGLVGLYLSTIGVVKTFAQFGINQSGVREVAVAAGDQDQERIAATVKTLRRVCWFTGIFGWALAVALAWPLSQWTFGSNRHALAISILGSVVFLELVSGGQKALLQGVRRVGDLAKLQIAFALISTLLAVGLYWWLREDGIVPVIIITSVVQLGASWWFARQVQVATVEQNWRQTLAVCRALFRLGASFMYGALLVALLGLVIRSLLLREVGIEGVGFYQAAWALSGMFGSFILQAMSMDFYPRLTAVVQDNKAANRLVNEQVEIGILLAMPGLILAAASAPWIVQLLYSRDFAESGKLLPWFLLGTLGQVVSWPVGMIPVAKAATGYIYLSRTTAALLHVGLAFLLVRAFGVVGAAAAFGIFVWTQNLLNQWMARRLIGFVYTRTCVKLGACCVAGYLLACILVLSLPTVTAALMNSVLFLLLSAISIKGLKLRVPKVADALKKYPLPFI
jgi:antigen flippase